MSKAQKGSNSPHYGKRGAEAYHFKRGCVYWRDGRSPRWAFNWYEDGTLRSKSFSAKKYGCDEAKRLAEEYRDYIYPIE